MKIIHSLFYILVVLSLTGLLACSDTDVKTQIVTEIVEVPPPEPDATNVSLNIVASQIDGALTSNGGAFPANIYEDGNIFFKGTSIGDEFNVGTTPFQSYDSFLVNDDYDALYRVDSPGSLIPLNQNATILADQTVDSYATIDLNITSVEVTPVFTLNGGNFPASQYDHGLFYLQPVNSNELIFIGDSNVVNQPVRVVPGDYHVVYDYVQGTASPINKNARVRETVTLDSDQVLNVDVSVGDFRATFSLNGNDFPISQYDHAEFYLKDRVTGGESFIMKSYEPFVTVPVIDGSYDIIYKVKQANTIPINSSKVILSELSLSGGGAITHDLVSITIDANVTLNGQPFQVSEYQDGIIELFDAATGSYTELGNTHNSFSNILIIPGAYDITYSHESGDAVPQNMHGVILSNQIIDADGDLNIDVVGVLVTTDITFNTIAFPQSQSHTAGQDHYKLNF